MEEESLVVVTMDSKPLSTSSIAFDEEGRKYGDVVGASEAASEPARE